LLPCQQLPDALGAWAVRFVPKDGADALGTLACSLLLVSPIGAFLHGTPDRVFAPHVVFIALMMPEIFIVDIPCIESNPMEAFYRGYPMNALRRCVTGCEQFGKSQRQRFQVSRHDQRACDRRQVARRQRLPSICWFSRTSNRAAVL
jgi:hypothetical protein